ncbi:uncharacterized protein LOC132281385 [Cornus florida]|uniref:uncharacterized protein LOC132281385 n=1 Tax=Cornus florida TaxID=4283 RepID=UPI0028A2402D|nr:uncharacterized protein LOC132281385 [Cornus florida]
MGVQQHQEILTSARPRGACLLCLSEYKGRSSSYPFNINGWKDYPLVIAKGTLDDPDGLFSTLAFSADGKRLFCKSGTTHIFEWNLQERAAKRTYRGFHGWSKGIMNFDTIKNKYLVASDSNLIKFWDMNNSDLLTTSDVVETYLCYLCLADNESMDHLFFKCLFSSRVWRVLQEIAGFYILPNCWTDLIEWCSTFWTSEKFLIHKLLLSAAIYFLWQERNFRAFRNTFKSPTLIISKIKSSTRSKLAAIKLKSSVDLRDISDPQDLHSLFVQSCNDSRMHS